VARALIDRGFKLVRPLAGGLDGWVAAGYQVEEDEPTPLTALAHS
jgi:rhodanese-related sulfurtransferase